jgi:lipopolysaccharide export LptBFGC system permease protein LptF
VRILDRYIWKELVTPFGLGLLIFTFLLLIDRIFDLTDLIINKGVPVHLVLMMLVYISPAILVLTIPSASCSPSWWRSAACPPTWRSWRSRRAG